MKRRRQILAVAVVLCLLLTGCGLHSDVLDQKAELGLQAIERNEPAELYAMLYPGLVEEEEFGNAFEQLLQYWGEGELRNLKLVQVHTRITSDGKTYSGIYRFAIDQKDFYLSITYREDDAGKGLTQFYINPVADSAADTRSFFERMRVPAFALSAGYQLLCWALIIMTIVDVVRQRPRRYGWYIVLSLLFFNVNIQSYVLSVPLGMIIYWAIRKQLLAKREAPSEPSDGKAGESVDGNDGQEQG